jgi:hypothetical protein
MQKCIHEIGNRFQDSSIQAHSKRFILITAFTVGFVIQRLVEAAVMAAIVGGAAVAIDNALNPAPDSVVFEDTSEDGVLAQANRITEASAIAFATGNDNGVMATITVPVTPSPTHQSEEVCQFHCKTRVAHPINISAIGAFQKS